MGLTAENLARKYRISRREQDEFALRSHQKAAQATDSGAFKKEIIPTWGRDDEGRNACSSRRISASAAIPASNRWPRSSPRSRRRSARVTAGNSSPLNAGAAALLIMSEERAKELGLKPKVKIRAMAVAGVDPRSWGIGPVPATHKVLERAGLKLSRHRPDRDQRSVRRASVERHQAARRESEKVNVRGGAIAIGHPLGASGARIAATLIHAMLDRKAKFGLATMCIGAGQGIATIFEAVE